MKNIMAGYMHPGCHAYCCPVGGGGCSYLGSNGSDASTNEGCQDSFIEQGASCAEGEYVAALRY